MRSQTIRLGIFISTLIIAAIIIFQLIWLRKVYLYEQKQFDHHIAKAIRGLFEDVDQPVDPQKSLNQLIVNPNSETYFIRLISPLPSDSLAYYMQYELESEDIFTDCHMGVYSSQQGRYVYTRWLRAATGSGNQLQTLPLSGMREDHLALYFPHRSRYILSLMNFWIIGSLLLLFVLILFSASLYYFYRQSFLNETQKDFVNNFTHEFKTPVSVINLAAEVLEKRDIASNPDRLAKYAAIVKYQGIHLQNQIERLLRYAYAESQHLHLVKEPLHLKSVVEEALENLHPLIEEKGAVIEYDFKATNDQLKADHGYLMVVLTNLLENALKYSLKPKVIIGSQNENGYILLSIKDNGKGIEKKYQKRIFKKFYRIPYGEQIAARGFGLGLSFVKRIVDAHHGKITVESIPDVGSNFIIRLPVS